MKKSKSKIKSKNLSEDIIKDYLIIFAFLFFVVCKDWCRESVDQAKGKDKVIVQIVNSAIHTTDFIEYLLNGSTSLTSSITRYTINQKQFNEMIISEALNNELIRQNISQNPYIRRIVCQILPEKQLKEKWRGISGKGLLRKRIFRLIMNIMNNANTNLAAVSKCI